MPDFRIADTAPEHRKLRSAGLAAAGLWSMAGAWSMRELTDGWVPAYWVQTWPAGSKAAATLVKVGLWEREERDGLPGFRFHDWEFYQRLSHRIEDEKRKARERMRALRSGAPETNGSGPVAARGSPERAPDVRPNTPRTFPATAGERAANVHDSLSLSGGDLGGERLVSNARASATEPPNTDLTSTNRPADRCSKHRHEDTDPGPCRGCMKAREHAEQWERQQYLDRIMANRNCNLCDADGWRYQPGTRVPLTPYERCDHRSLRSVS
jgi:hypothetical protein